MCSFILLKSIPTPTTTIIIYQFFPFSCDTSNAWLSLSLFLYLFISISIFLFFSCFLSPTSSQSQHNNHNHNTTTITMIILLQVWAPLSPSLLVCPARARLSWRQRWWEAALHLVNSTPLVSLPRLPPRLLPSTGNVSFFFPFPIAS